MTEKLSAFTTTLVSKSREMRDTKEACAEPCSPPSTGSGRTD
jgi:hypothetical protein